MTPEEHKAFLDEAGKRIIRRRVLRVTLNVMNMPALANMVGQMGDTELDELDTLIYKPSFTSCERGPSCPNFKPETERII